MGSQYLPVGQGFIFDKRKRLQILKNNGKKKDKNDDRNTSTIRIATHDYSLLLLLYSKYIRM
jgi:hypothetical protein